ncbi:MAG: hypothetical protein AB9883_05575 [Acidaminococcaceae bacterium]
MGENNFDSKYLKNFIVKITENSSTTNADVIKNYQKRITSPKKGDNTNLEIEDSIKNYYDLKISELGTMAHKLQEDLNSQKKNIEDELKKLKENNENISKKEQELYSKLGEFNKNIITIMSMLLAAFAFIGVNITSIKDITSPFTVLIINMSLVFSLSAVFLLLDCIISDGGKLFDSKGTRVGTALIISSLVLIIVLLSIKYYIESNLQISMFFFAS